MIDARGNIEEVKASGHPPVAKGVVLVDFDGTLYPFGDLFGWSPPIPGAREAMKWLKAHGYTIVIFTSRFSRKWLEHEERDVKEQDKYIRDILNRDDIPFHSITAEKIPAEAYFDDRAFRVTKEHNLFESVADFMREKKK